MPADASQTRRPQEARDAFAADVNAMRGQFRVDPWSPISPVGAPVDGPDLLGEGGVGLSRAETGRRCHGRTIGDFDLLIAATCLRHQLQIRTNNRRHFEVVEGLRSSASELNPVRSP